MSNKLILFFYLMFISLTSHTQNTYSKDEINMKFELQQEKINSKLDAIERENNSIDAKIAAQDKLIVYQDKQIENLKFLFGILLSLIGIIVALSTFFINKRNKEQFADLEEELKTAKDNALQELQRIKEIADLEVRMAKTEINELKLEAKKLKEKI